MTAKKNVFSFPASCRGNLRIFRNSFSHMSLFLQFGLVASKPQQIKGTTWQVNINGKTLGRRHYGSSNRLFVAVILFYIHRLETYFLLAKLLLASVIELNFCDKASGSLRAVKRLPTLGYTSQKRPAAVWVHQKLVDLQLSSAGQLTLRDQPCWSGMVPQRPGKACVTRTAQLCC